MNRTWRTFLEGAALLGMLIPGGPAIYGISRSAIRVGAWALGTIVSSLPIHRSGGTRYAGQTYTWEHKANQTASDGTPMPIIYGKTRIKPTLKNRYIRLEGSKQFLYALYSFACHRIDERAVSPWVSGHSYVVGEEVSAPASAPWWWRGFTFICTRSHVSSDTLRSSIYAPLFIGPTSSASSIEWHFWRVGPGTAAISAIMVNGHPITDYSGITWETRPGLAQQGVVQGFDRTYVDFPVGTSVNKAIPVVLIQSGVAQFNYLAGHITCSVHQVYYAGALYTIKAQSNIGLGKVYWTPPASSDLESSYSTSSGTFEIVDFHGVPSSSAWTWQQRAASPSGSDWSTVNVTTATTQNLAVDLVLPNGLLSLGLGSNTAGSVYSQPARIFAQYRRVVAGAAAEVGWLSFGELVDSTQDTMLLEAPLGETGLVRKTDSSIHVTLYAVPVDSQARLTAGSYQVRVCVIAPADATLESVSSITYGNFTYPGEPLLGIRALASQRLSGDIEVTAVCERSTVWVHNGSSWSELAASNPAWACYDLLAQGAPDHPSYAPADPADAMSTYGGSVPHSRIDYASFSSWASHLTSLSMSLNTVFDDWTTVWDAILRVCSEFRGSVVPFGSSYRAIVDKAVAPAQLLCVGNTALGSLRVTWPDRSARAGSIEATFFDSDRDYEAVTFVVRGSSWTTREPMRMTLFGTTSMTQAYAIAHYFLLCNELLTLTAELSAPVSELQLEVGDVVLVQNDVQEWGRGGRILNWQPTDIPTPGHEQVTLDQAVTLAPSTHSYSLVVRHAATDTLETHAIENTADETTASIQFSSGTWSTAPAPDDVWALGETSGGSFLDIRTMRVIDMQRDGELNRQVTLLDYDSAVYAVPSSTPDLGLAKAAADPFNLASSIRATERLSQRPTGEYEYAIEVTWSASLGTQWGEWEVEFRDVDAADTNWDGSWSAGSYSMFDKVYADGSAFVSLSDDNTTEPFLIE